MHPGILLPSSPALLKLPAQVRLELPSLRALRVLWVLPDQALEQKSRLAMTRLLVRQQLAWLPMQHVAADSIRVAIALETEVRSSCGTVAHFGGAILQLGLRIGRGRFRGMPLTFKAWHQGDGLGASIHHAPRTKPWRSLRTG